MDFPDSTKLTFLRKQHEYDEVYSYIFEPSSPVTFTAGEYAHVRLLSLPETTRRVREISFASSPQDSHIQFGIDGRSGSDYQKALHALNQGDGIEIFKIKGHMTWPADVSHTVMIAGGIGVTPFRSMLRDRKQKNIVTTATLLHVSTKFFLYEDELRELASDYRTIGREGLSKELELLTQAHPNSHYYIAGSVSFVDRVTQELNQLKITKIETDGFKGLKEEL